VIRLFLDFDGTVAINDVGDAFFQTFGQFEPVHSELLAGKHSVAEYYSISASLLRGATTDALRTFLASQELDPAVPDLIRWCEEVGIHVAIVSDGFDIYIKPMLQAAGLGHVPVFCNTLHEENGHWTPFFPGASESCTCFCASCKRNVLLASGPDDVIVYVGDGRSDRCAVEHADVVLAKSGLIAWCVANGIPHHNVHTMFDVWFILQSRFERNDLRSRRHAELARKRAFEQE
jgi:2-hydroxy-3-keto-5-methylthiopentenyl-1-phosphate phosphatase